MLMFLVGLGFRGFGDRSLLSLDLALLHLLGLFECLESTHFAIDYTQKDWLVRLYRDRNSCSYHILALNLMNERWIILLLNASLVKRTWSLRERELIQE